MIKITEEQRRLLERYLGNAEELVRAGDLYELELALDIALTDIGMDGRGELNDDGMILQKLYDEIYLQNDE